MTGKRRARGFGTLLLCTVASAHLTSCEQGGEQAAASPSSPECMLAAQTLEAQVQFERPLPRRWSLSTAEPARFWDRERFAARAALESENPTGRSSWYTLIEEERQSLPWFPPRPEMRSEPAAGPSSAMAAAFAAAEPVNAAACPEVRAYARRARTLPSTDEPRRFGEFIFMVERPVISPDGTEAIVVVDMGSVGRVVLYRKQTDGEWREAAFTNSFIS